MKKTLKKALAAFLVAIMVLSVSPFSGLNFDFSTKVSAAETEGYIFDEETGTLTLLDDNAFDEFDEFDENMFIELNKKVKIFNIGKDVDSLGWFFNGAAEINVDPENKSFCIYDKGLYTIDKTQMIAYPCGSDDTDIILPEECTNIEYSSFLDYTCLLNDSFRFFAINELPIRNDYSLYITSENQIEKLIASGYNFIYTFFYYSPFANIYINQTQEKIDSTLIESHGLGVTTYNLSGQIIVMNDYFPYYLYYTRPEEADSITSELYGMLSSSLNELEYVEYESETDYYNAYIEVYDLIIDYGKEKGYFDLCELTTDNFDAVYFSGDTSKDEAEKSFNSDEELVKKYGTFDNYYNSLFESCSAYFSAMYERMMFMLNRKDFVRPLSDFSGGKCGENAQWSIDKTTGTVTISGSGTVNDSFSGLDLFRDAVTYVEIGNDITAIGSGAFKGCAGLKEVYIGKNCTQIGSSIFDDCDNLSVISVTSDEISLGENAFGTSKPDFVAKDGSSTCQTLKDAGYNVIRYSLDQTFSEEKRGEEKPVLAFLDTIALENGLNYKFFTNLILNNPEVYYVYFEKVDFKGLIAEEIILDTEDESFDREQVYFGIERVDYNGDSVPETVRLSDAEKEQSFFERLVDFFVSMFEFFTAGLAGIVQKIKALFKK